MSAITSWSKLSFGQKKEERCWETDAGRRNSMCKGSEAREGSKGEEFRVTGVSK